MLFEGMLFEIAFLIFSFSMPNFHLEEISFRTEALHQGEIASLDPPLAKLRSPESTVPFRRTTTKVVH